MDWKNTLYFGDNLEVLRAKVPSESVDLIYLDPPFNSNANYDVLFKEKSGEESAAQILTIEELLDSKQLLFPRHRVETFKKAERQSKDAASQSDLF